MPHSYKQPLALSAEHVEGAKLFATRMDMIRGLPIAKGGIIAEVGVMKGDFSVFMMDILKPKKFVAFDWFTVHEMTEVWGMPTTQMFENMTHLDFYRKRMAVYGDVMVIEKGLSTETMPKHGDHSFDLVYIDAGHDYDNVKSDATNAAKMANDAGILVFNDYIMEDYINDQPYGIVQVVNEMVVEQDWRVIGFSFHSRMFCDIALQKKNPRSRL